MHNYITEYMAAFDHTESFGLQAPPRVLVRKECPATERMLHLILEYFDRHTIDELMGQTLAINTDLISILWHKTGVPYELTIGTVVLGEKRYGECSDALIRSYLDEKLIAWQREGVPFHVWLTTPACDVLDVTFAMNLGWSKTREECARRLIYKPVSSPHSAPPTYHPFLVGEDFLYKSGVMIDLAGSLNRQPACE